jgi:transforming growth factor-beta-induced protein
MMQAITIVLTKASVAGSASRFATSAPHAFSRALTSRYMSTAVPVTVPNDIVDTAVAAGSFNTLAAALGAADLVTTLKSEGPFTVFAPTDEAFAKLPEGTIADLLKPENKAKLAAILTYHVLAGEVMASTVVTMDGKTAATVNGASVTIGVKDGTVTVDDAKVLTTDIKTSNGVIHIIDSVLIPK